MIYDSHIIAFKNPGQLMNCNDKIVILRLKDEVERHPINVYFLFGNWQSNFAKPWGSVTVKPIS